MQLARCRLWEALQDKMTQLLQKKLQAKLNTGRANL